LERNVSREDDLITSPLSRDITRDGTTVKISIYREPTDDGWLLEVKDETGGLTVWKDPYPSEQAALDEAMHIIQQNGVRSFAANGLD
jgi:uncharacterized protein